MTQVGIRLLSCRECTTATDGATSPQLVFGPSNDAPPGDGTPAESGGTPRGGKWGFIQRKRSRKPKHVYSSAIDADQPGARFSPTHAVCSSATAEG